MPMKTLAAQQAGRQLGRIRAGIQIPTKGGRSRPGKLENFRFTCASQYVAQHVAALYGGEARPWEGAPTTGQWEVLSNTAELRVAIPPGEAAMSQWFEMWSGGGCVRRCDGEVEQLSKSPCMCPLDPATRAAQAQNGGACKPTTRLNVILPDIPDVGVWRLDSHGFYAAVELGATATLLAAASAQNLIIPAVLRLEQRQTRSIRDGKAETRNFGVPVLEVQWTLRELVGAGGGSTLALPPAPDEPLRAIEGAPVRARDSHADITTTEQWAAAVTVAPSREELAALGRVARFHGWGSDLLVQLPGRDALEALGDLWSARDAELQREAG